jgi:hypothetical protein
MHSTNCSGNAFTPRDCHGNDPLNILLSDTATERSTAEQYIDIYIYFFFLKCHCRWKKIPDAVNSYSYTPLAKRVTLPLSSRRGR